MEKIKILHVVSSLSTGSGVMGFIMNYFRNINSEKIQFDFLYFKEIEGTYKEEIEFLGGHTFCLVKPGFRLATRMQYNHFFSRHANEYVALHNHEVYLTFFLAPIAKKNGIKHIITHSHATMFSDNKIKALRNRILCFPLKRQANHYFTCSKAAGTFLYGEKAIRAGKVMVINNAINCKRFQYNETVRDDVRNGLGLTGKVVVGHVGRFTEQKNHVFLIDIFNEIHKKNNNTVLMLVGRGPLEKKIKQKVENLGLNSFVFFLGQRGDIPDLLQAMDVFVLPSLYEGLPVIGIEAQSTGLPCVMSDKITKEIDITNVDHLKLSASLSNWSELIIKKAVVHNRNDTTEQIKLAGLDINEEAKNLEKIYAEMSGDER